jgi:hypothetical protein
MAETFLPSCGPVPEEPMQNPNGSVAIGPKNFSISIACLREIDFRAIFGALDCGAMNSPARLTEIQRFSK